MTLNLMSCHELPLAHEIFSPLHNYCTVFIISCSNYSNYPALTMCLKAQALSPDDTSNTVFTVNFDLKQFVDF